MGSAFESRGWEEMANDTRSGAGLVLVWGGWGEAPQVHILIPLGYGMAAAMNRGPVTPSVSLVCPLSVSLVGWDGGLPLSVETLTFLFPRGTIS